MAHIAVQAQEKQETSNPPGTPDTADTSVAQESAKNEEDSLNYQVDVSVKLLPVFALDANGNPVYDLEQQDMELYVNGEPRDIAYFKRYDFESNTIEKRQKVQDERERVVFIILDTMFSTNTGFKRAKVIAGDIVKQCKPGDQFVVFENSLLNGLRYIAGSSDSQEILLGKIAALRRPIEKWSTHLFNTRDLSNNIDFSIETEERMETEHWNKLRDFYLDSEAMRYKHQVEHFCRVLSQFKYILKTISKPKLVFLLSEGMADGAFKMKLLRTEIKAVEDPRHESDAELRRSQFDTVLVKSEKDVLQDDKAYSTDLFRYLNEIIRSINYGGSVLHTINPGRPNDTNDAGVSGEKSLKYLADESGGGYFTGSNTKEIAKRIVKSTSAYYEMVFYIDPTLGDNLQVELKCKRSGVRVYTTGHAEGGRSYRDMDPVQKRMFALNVVTGGSWSRNSGKVMLIPYRKQEVNKNAKEEFYTLDVPLPNQMKNKKLDIFLIQRDPETNRVDMSLVNKNAKNWVKIKIKSRGSENLEKYFVIVEPLDTYCIYNKT
jgi:VWFA-related protein